MVRTVTASPSTAVTMPRISSLFICPAAAFAGSADWEASGDGEAEVSVCVPQPERSIAVSAAQRAAAIHFFITVFLSE
jgi:hypothetical protein